MVYGLTPLDRCKFWVLLYDVFTSSEKVSFLCRTSTNTSSLSILHYKKNMEKSQFFEKKKTLKKCKFGGSLKAMFL